MRIEQDLKLDFKDVLIRPKRSTLKSRKQVDLMRDFTFRNSGQIYSGVPIIAANMDTVGTMDMTRALAKHGMMVALHKYYTTDELADFLAEEGMPNHAFASFGVTENDFERIEALSKRLSNHVQYICMDVANGYTEAFVDAVKRVRDTFPTKTIMAGNVVTGEMTEELILSGADIVKVGIGPGSVCTTRKMTGVGYPQLSAIIECADAAHGLGGHVCADGGCTVPGDIAKAFGAGADFVMLGGMLAGHDESAGELVEENGRKFKRFYGMSSAEAMNTHHGGVASYRAPEGKSVNVPYKGAVEMTAQEILGGVRSACTYVGAQRLKELSKRTTFVRVSQQINNIFTGMETGL
ncbi:MAG: GMP reductase [Proteobacteria bacterium]|nr:GMP reductase [Pseudomonadota bacterium]